VLRCRDVSITKIDGTKGDWIDSPYPNQKEGNPEMSKTQHEILHDAVMLKGMLEAINKLDTPDDRGACIAVATVAELMAGRLVSDIEAAILPKN